MGSASAANVSEHRPLTHFFSSAITNAEGRPAKRQRLADNASENAREISTRPRDTLGTSSFSPRTVVPDSDADSQDELFVEHGEPTEHRQTDLEQALPPVKSDKEAIREYEALRAAGLVPQAGSQGSSQSRQWVEGKSSIYTDAFSLALETVLDEESHLFSHAEKCVFQEWNALSYEAQYLYVRLFLRKTSAWHRVNRLRYYSDISNIDSTVEELFRSREVSGPPDEALQGPPIISDESHSEDIGATFCFADSSEDCISSLEEASSLLMLDELKVIAKDAKVQGKNKTELLAALRRASGRQRAIGFPLLQRADSVGSSASADNSVREDTPPTKDASLNRDQYYTQKILSETGTCIRLSLLPMRLFERVHLVFYRSTEWTEKSLTTLILAQIARRNFPAYIVSRSANIFPSRSMLLEFEASLRIQFRIDSILEFNGTPKIDDLQIIVDIFNKVYPRWTQLVNEEHQKENSIYCSGEGAYLRRLSPAWVYTRIVHKGAFVLGQGKFKQHAREHAVLTDLLAQDLFHTARRGAWYQRKALLEEHYMHELSPAEGRSADQQKKHWKRIALRTCEMGLQDNLVHLVYHYDLQKRLTKLERKLKIPKRQQHDFGHQQLAKPVEVDIQGIRVEKRSRTQNTQLVREDSESKTAVKVSIGRRDSDASPARPSAGPGGRTIWLDPLEDFGECSVEAMCLSHYRSQGWKGFHSEGGILRTLFALLFYDVLFAYVPNVFQTPFQTCPLDLHSDAFYPTRMSEINARLAELANGEATRILSEVWNRECEKRTCVVGLDWSFELKDLLAICRCFQPLGLVSVCKIMAQEYAERGGGVPDLFLWREEDDDDCKSGTVCFAEVKSENDRLSDNQRLWIHVLAGAGIRVELANAVASEVRVVSK